ncbi:MAG: hypothetical protein ABIJ56_11645 [Pseudomonadota bacterium]
MKNLGIILCLLAACAWACGGSLDTDGDAHSDGEDTSPDGDDAAADTAGDGDDAHDQMDDPVDDRPPDVVPDVPDATDTIDAPDTTDAPETVDTVEEEVTVEPTVCVAYDTRCSGDLSSLEECREDGSGWDAAPCEFECGEEPDPHCLVWRISNIDDHELLSAGAEPTGDPLPTEGEFWLDFDTDTGEVILWRRAGSGTGWEHERDVRPEGEGLDAESGIHFTIVEQEGDAPDLGVFSLQRLFIPENYTFGPWGANPLVLLSEENALIQGGVYVGCHWNEGEPLAGAAESSEGPGAGGDGSSAPDGEGIRDGGGGGGAFGGGGGNGGGYTAGLRGAGGGGYGTIELIPLIGGSGGGMGGGTGAGRWGGRSGGAVQIVSAATITVDPGGYVDAGGCGGVASGSYENAEAGGGGGSGGGILLEALTIEIVGGVTANGGGGAAGGTSYGSSSLNGEHGQVASSTAAAGGTATSSYACDGGDGNGGGGNAGSNAPTCDESVDDYNGGGGGGGGGRIRLNAMERDITGLLCPAMTASSTTEGDLNLE